VVAICLAWTYDLYMTRAAQITADAASFGSLIRRLRMSEGWTIAELGRRSGFNKNHLSLIEMGKNMPSLNMLFALAEIFHIDAAEMVREVESARRGRKAARAAAMLEAAGLNRTEAIAESESAGEAKPTVE
jgi:transcriptional regulator with XRE-family HTH domain